MTPYPATWLDLITQSRLGHARPGQIMRGPAQQKQQVGSSGRQPQKGGKRSVTCVLWQGLAASGWECLLVEIQATSASDFRGVDTCYTRGRLHKQAQSLVCC